MNVLVVAAHSDDEVLGCGASIARHVSMGNNVDLVVLSDGESSRENLNIKQRESALARSCSILGIKSFDCLNLRDNALDSYPLLEIIKKLDNKLDGKHYELVYTHFSSDLNVDHRITNQVVHTLFRPQPGESVSEIRAFEVVSSTHWNTYQQNTFNPNLFIDVSNFVTLKMKALECYEDEMREYPHARSIEAVSALLKFRGSTVGLHAAEAFIIERKIEGNNENK